MSTLKLAIGNKISISIPIPILIIQIGYANFAQRIGPKLSLWGAPAVVFAGSIIIIIIIVIIITITIIIIIIIIINKIPKAGWFSQLYLIILEHQ
jgi:hypothetical protein